MIQVLMNFKTTITLALLVLCSGALLAQSTPSKERSSFERRKTSIMDGNQLRATYHNTGHAGRRNSQSLDELIFEFPKNTNREYMYFMSLMYGTQVPDAKNSGNPLAIVNTASYKSSRDGRTNYSLNPIVGYVRDDNNEIARSDRGPGSVLGNTWPDVWPDKLGNGGDGWSGSWNGFFGRDQFNADVEFYYKAGDDTYTKYINENFYPDLTDPSRGGLGVMLDTRVLAWSQTLVNATHFNIFEIINDASFDYPRMAFGLWIADFVAGRSVTNKPIFDNIRSIAYLTDTNRENGGAAFGGTKVGEMGIKFLETPGNSIDGIDNDGDSDEFNSSLDLEPGRQSVYNPDNKDLYRRLTTAEGGFYTYEALRDSVIPIFKPTDFDNRTINLGDKIVLIQDDFSRVIKIHDGTPFKSQGITYNFSGSFVAREDFYPSTDPQYGIHMDGLDNDFDGLIDENRPNHLTKSTFINGVSVVRPVRYINYLHFAPGDTIQRGLIVPNQAIRDRIASDPAFATLVNDTYDGRFQNFHTSAPMIDEARDDFFDNDDDWESAFDDVGVQGNPDKFSFGQGDSKPTSGAGTAFPGEPNIDKTDVSETDMIGVSRVTIFPSGALDVNLDADIWTKYLTPGAFLETAGSDSDIFVSSGLFPLPKGSSQRFAVAVTAAATNSPTAAGDRAQTNRNLDQATIAYESDYQFAVAPTPPVVTAVPSDGKVTLYWNEESERSFDRYINRITGNGYDFEGYKIYRSTEEAFEDVLTITDAYGTPLFFRPLAIFDKENGKFGLHPIPINGVQFNMGDDSGIQRVFVDNEVMNGRKYYYAVTAFDYGLESAGIAPSESPIQISKNPDGTVTLGQNVVSVRPVPSAAGYIAPENPNATLVSGSPGGTVKVDVIDPMALKPENLYEVTFEDSLYSGGVNQDTLKTKNFTLRNITGGANDTLIARSTNFNGENNPIIDGYAITLNNIERLELDNKRSGWFTQKSDSLPGFSFVVNSAGSPKISDYHIVVGDSAYGKSTRASVEVVPNFSIIVDSIATNFRIFNTYTDEEIKYAFLDLNAKDAPQAPLGRKAACDPKGNNKPVGYVAPSLGFLSTVASLAGPCSDQIYLIEDYRGTPDSFTYQIELQTSLSNNKLTTRNPVAGDTLKIFTTKPFSQNDRFQFKMDEKNLPHTNADSAKAALDNIMVIPNPYVVSNIYEASITNTNRQQNRELHFTGLPAKGSLRIFTVSGVLIKDIEITPDKLVGANGGTYIWNMLTKDNLEISYGIYLYQVSAPGIGKTTGKFAVIK
ncbi:MAG: hypothetical protein WC967_07720 [Balneolaceae bacterium]